MTSPRRLLAAALLALSMAGIAGTAASAGAPSPGTVPERPVQGLWDEVRGCVHATGELENRCVI